MNERKWQQPQLQLHLVTKSHSRWELGLPTSSAAVLPLKMMPCTMFWSIQTFSANGKFTERYHIFCARIDLFTIFVCSRYRPWATIRLLYHSGFVMCVNSRLYCTHFSCQWCKIHNVSYRLTQISKRQRNPRYINMYIGGILLYSFIQRVFIPSMPPPPPPPPPTHTPKKLHTNTHPLSHTISCLTIMGSYNNGVL